MKDFRLFFLAVALMVTTIFIVDKAVSRDSTPTPTTIVQDGSVIDERFLQLQDGHGLHCVIWESPKGQAMSCDWLRVLPPEAPQTPPLDPGTGA